MFFRRRVNLVPLNYPLTEEGTSFVFTAAVDLSARPYYPEPTTPFAPSFTLPAQGTVFRLSAPLSGLGIPFPFLRRG